jgi:hypothetical protein
VWDTVTRQPLAVFMGNMAVNAVAYSPKLPLVLSGLMLLSLNMSEFLMIAFLSPAFEYEFNIRW